MSIGRSISTILLISSSLTTLCQVPNPEHVVSISNGAFGDAPMLQGVNSVAVSNGYAYALSYYTNSIEIFDVSNPAQPTPVSRISRDSLDFLVAMPQAMQIVDQYLYVLSSGDNALEIIDIADPTSPKHIGNIVHGDGGANFSRPRDLAVRNGFAYVLVYDGIEIIDVSNPHNPIHTGFMDLNLSFGGLIRISGNYLYVHTGSFMGIFDLSTPSTLVTQSYFQLVPNSEPKAFYVEGNYAYHAWGGVNTDGFEIIDVSNPTSPTRTAQLLAGQGGTVLQEPSALFTKEGFAYLVSAESNILEIINVQDPQHPDKVGSLTQLGSPESITLAGNLAFIGGSQSLNIVDVAIASNPILIKPINNSLGGTKLKSVVDISINGDKAYILSDRNLEVLDVSNPLDIKRAGRIDYGTTPFSASPTKVIARGEQVFTLDNEVLSIHNKALNLVSETFGKIKNIERNYRAFIHVRGQNVFWMNRFGSIIEVTNITNPAQPTKASELDLNFNFERNICVFGGYIYAVGDGLLKIVDMSDLRIVSTLSILTTEPSHLDKYQITAGIGMAFILLNNSLKVVDVSNPLAPNLVNNSALERSTKSILRFHEGYLYLIDPDTQTFEVIDFSNPALPQTIASLKNGMDDLVLYSSGSLTIAGSFAYVGNLFGIEIINLNIPVVTGFDPVEELQTDKNLTLFPNPATREISINLGDVKDHSMITIDIYTSLGKHVEQIKSKGEKLVKHDISALNEGVYIIIILDGSQRSYAKFMKY